MPTSKAISKAIALQSFTLFLICLLLPQFVAAQLFESTITGWDRGVAEVFNDGDGPVPDTIGQVAADGAVSLRFPEAGETPVTLDMLPCMRNAGVTIDKPKVAVDALSPLLGVKAPGDFSPQKVLGQLVLADSAALAQWLSNPMNNSAVPGRYAMTIHVAEEALAKGDCEVDMTAFGKPLQRIELDYHFRPGWNLVVSEILAVSDGAITRQRQATVPFEDLDFAWRFLEK